MKIGLLAGTLAAVVLGLLIGTSSARAQAAPPLINYQGKLLDQGSGLPIDGDRQMHFAVLDSATVGTGTVLWGETQTVSVQAGIYQVLLGSVTPIGPSVFAGPDRWLEIAVAGETLAPRQRLASAPYALSCDLNNLYANQDADGDGHKSVIFGGDDCNDADPAAHPGAVEIPGDGIDQSCDGDDFGYMDGCQRFLDCGFDVGGCEEGLGSVWDLGLTSVASIAACTAAAPSCLDLETCMMNYETDVRDELCVELDGCGYLNYFDCQDQIDQAWDGWMEQLQFPTACIRNDGTCDPAVIAACLIMEEFQYGNYTWVPSSSTGYSLNMNTYILFGDTGLSYSIRTPKGANFPLTLDWGWDWRVYGGDFGGLGGMAYVFPSGQYELLQGTTVIDVFQVLAYVQQDFPRGVYAVDPVNGTSVDQDPLPVSWQYTGGNINQDAEVRLENHTRGGEERIEDIPPDVITATVAVPAGTQFGDELWLGANCYSPEQTYSDDLSQVFVRYFNKGYFSIHTWTGP